MTCLFEIFFSKVRCYVYVYIFCLSIEWVLVCKNSFKCVWWNFFLIFSLTNPHNTVYNILGYGHFFTEEDALFTYLWVYQHNTRKMNLMIYSQHKNQCTCIINKKLLATDLLVRIFCICCCLLPARGVVLDINFAWKYPTRNTFQGKL